MVRVFEAKRAEILSLNARQVALTYNRHVEHLFHLERQQGRIRKNDAKELEGLHLLFIIHKSARPAARIVLTSLLVVR